MVHELPEWLTACVEQAVYLRWLERKARSHVRRDRKRGNATAKPAAYRHAIHDAVLASRGRDAYTGAPLDWSLISRYDNTDSKRHGRAYKKRFADLPTVDHVDEGLGAPNFVISSWRTNDSKNDLTLDEFIVLCTAVLEHHGYRVTRDPLDES